MTPRARDAADRWLGLVIRLLPASRAQWGHAMRAELAALENAADRRRFALSCTRVALVPTAGHRNAPTISRARAGETKRGEPG